MKNALISILIVASGITLLTCKDAAEQIMPQPPVPGPGSGPVLEITDEQRLAVLKECRDFVQTLGDLRSDAVQQLLVAWLKSRPEFEVAGINRGTVWAHFYDGRIVSIVPDWLDKDSYNGRVAAPDISGGRDFPDSTTRTGEVPGGKKVLLFHGLGNAYDDNRTHLEDIFSRSHTQYQAESKDATIENLKNAKDVDIFYIDSHGAFAFMRPLEDSQVMYSLWTSEIVTMEREDLYEQDLDDHALNYMIAVEDIGANGEDIHEVHYGIGPDFVSKYMTFGENSMMYLDVCRSMTPQATDIKKAMMKAAKKQLATYIGWSDDSDQGSGLPTAKFVFDRLLGAQVFMPETPGQRPFDLEGIFSEFPKYNLGVSGYGGRLKYESVTKSDIILTPSIEYITMDDYQSQMTIKGLFGDNARGDGKVKVGSLTVPISSWGPHEIICELPVTGPGSSGDVMVTVNGHESNKVPLSEWTIPLNLSKDYGITLEANLKLKIRADVHSYRSKPGETPKDERPDPLGILSDQSNLGWLFSAGSSGTYIVGGQRQASCTADKCLSQETQSAVSRNGALPYANSGGHGYSAFYKWSTNMKKLYVHVIVDVPDVGVEVKFHTACEGRVPIDGAVSLVSEFIIDTTVSPGLPVLEFSLDENHNIQSGRIVVSEDATWSVCMKPDKLVTTARWPTVTPTVAPKSDTEARIASHN